MMERVPILAFVFTLVFSGGVAAANLLTNPGFESGFTAWTLTPSAGSNPNQYFIDTSNPRSGSKDFAIKTQPGTGNGVLTQDVVTVVGTVYSFWCYIAADAFDGNGFTLISLGSSEVIPANMGGIPTIYKKFSGTFTATSLLTEFRIRGFNNGGTTHFDDCAVEISSGLPSGTPDRLRHRRQLQSLNQMRRSSPHCPPEMNACPTASGGYECLDYGELTACGGCTYPYGKGQDCTALPGVLNVGCSILDGLGCVVTSCKKGYRLQYDDDNATGKACLPIV